MHPNIFGLLYMGNLMFPSEGNFYATSSRGRYEAFQKRPLEDVVSRSHSQGTMHSKKKVVERT